MQNWLVLDKSLTQIGVLLGSPITVYGIHTFNRQAEQVLAMFVSLQH